MFESRANRGRANGYASLDSSGLVPTSSLPPIQSTIDTGSFATTSSLQSLVNATGSFATTGSNQFSGSQVITGSLTVTSTVINNSNLQLTGSDLIIDSGSLRISGGMYVSGSVTVSSTFVNNANLQLTGSDLIIESGSLILSGSTVYGDIIPAVSKSFSLGSNEFPFRDIFISSGSLNIASDNLEAPNTTLSNVDGNILISAGGMQLLGSASFNATTASFGYISGSMTQVGDYTQTGNYTVIGDKTITGSLTLSADSPLNINDGFYVNGAKQFNYGQFSDTTIQSGSANTAYAMKLNTTDLSSGFTVVSGSRVTATNTGTYNLQFSAQLEQTTNNSPEVSIWLRKNGTNVPNSNTELTIEKVAGGGKLVAAWNYIVQLNATQYVELMWSSTRSDTQLHFHDVQSTPTRPTTPSVILTMTQIA